jgi:hypothetical protein
MTMTAIQTASSTRITSDDFRCRRSQFIVVLRYDQLASGTAYGDPYLSRQPTSTLLVTPLVTTTGPVARQTPVPPSYCGLCLETVKVPTGTGSENRPVATTVMPTMCPLDSWRVICPLRARGQSPGGPPTAWSVPVTVPVGPGGPHFVGSKARRCVVVLNPATVETMAGRSECHHSAQDVPVGPRAAFWGVPVTPSARREQSHGQHSSHHRRRCSNNPGTACPTT